MKRMALLLLFMLSNILMANTSEGGGQSFVSPAAAYLNGVGGIYGVAAGRKNLLKDGVSILAGKSFGSIEGHGIVIADIPVITKKLKLSFGRGELDRLDHRISYTRGFDNSGTVVRQEMEGSANFYALGLDVIENHLSLGFSVASSSLSFVAFKTKEGKKINLNMASIHTVTPNIKTFSLKLNFVPVNIRDKYSVEIHPSVSTVEGRIAQSDLKVTSIKLKGHRAFGPRFKLNFVTQWQKASVIKEAGVAKINAECASRNSDADVISALKETLIVRL